MADARSIICKGHPYQISKDIPARNGGSNHCAQHIPLQFILIDDYSMLFYFCQAQCGLHIHMAYAKKHGRRLYWGK
jgi:hypothetical protein